MTRYMRDRMWHTVEFVHNYGKAWWTSSASSRGGSTIDGDDDDTLNIAAIANSASTVSALRVKTRLRAEQGL